MHGPAIERSVRDRLHQQRRTVNTVARKQLGRRPEVPTGPSLGLPVRCNERSEKPPSISTAVEAIKERLGDKFVRCRLRLGEEFAG